METNELTACKIMRAPTGSWQFSTLYVHLPYRSACTDSTYVFVYERVLRGQREVDLGYCKHRQALR